MGRPLRLQANYGLLKTHPSLNETVRLYTDYQPINLLKKKPHRFRQGFIKLFRTLAVSFTYRQFVIRNS